MLLWGFEVALDQDKSLRIGALEWLDDRVSIDEARSHVANALAISTRRTRVDVVLVERLHDTTTARISSRLTEDPFVLNGASGGSRGQEKALALRTQRSFLEWCQNLSRASSRARGCRVVVEAFKH